MPVLEAGQTFERYRIIRELGNSVSGESYEAEDTMLLRKVTLKLIHPWAMLPDSSRRQFFREMQGISLLNASYLAPMLDYGEINGRLYVARRYVTSGSLLSSDGRSWFRPPLLITDAISYCYQLAQALEYIHNHNYLHGGLTFSNILILRGPNLDSEPNYAPFLLADVGLANFVRRFGQSNNSPLPITAAPEQLGQRVTPASDQFALAVLFYFWLSGRPPYLGTSDEIEYHKLTQTITPLSSLNPMVTLELEGVVQRALSVYPEERYPSILAFASALLAASTTRPVPVLETISQQEATHQPEPVQLLADNISPIIEPELPPQNSITHVNDVEVLTSLETKPSFDFEPPTQPEPHEPQTPQEPETHPQPAPDVPQPDEPDTHPQQPEPETPQPSKPATLPEPTPQKVPDVPQPLPEPEVPEPNPEPSPQPAPQRETPQPTPDPVPQPAPDIPQPLPQPEIPQIEPQTPPQIEPYAGEALSFSQASRGASSNSCHVEPNISPRFVIISPYEGEPYEVLLEQKETTIGRAGSSDILLDKDNLTSRHHALLKNEDNHYVIYDRGSANGVFVNGQKLIGNAGYMLLDGDHISVGNYELIFRYRIPKNVGENVEVFSASSA